MPGCLFDEFIGAAPIVQSLSMQEKLGLIKANVSLFGVILTQFA